MVDMKVGLFWLLLGGGRTKTGLWHFERKVAGVVA